jgi:hypothetical protein
VELSEEVEELDEDEAGEGDSADHEEALNANQQVNQDHDDCALVDRNNQPIDERLGVELIACLRALVECRVLQGNFPRNVLVKDEREDWQHSEDGGISQQKYAVVDGQSHEEELDAEDGLHDGDDESTVDDELGKQRTALVGQSTVPVEQPVEVGECRNGEIAGQSSLNAFLPVYSYTHMRRLD